MAQQHTIGKVYTSHGIKNGVIRVTYHQTDVVIADAEKITLDTGGWFTNTTKTRMNQAANQYDLGFCVFQKKGEWFVKLYPYGKEGKVIPFVGNSVTFSRK